jgi:hypothetical protein
MVFPGRHLEEIMMSNRIYCFSLYCEGRGQTKSQAFATIRESRQAAMDAANRQNKRDFPPELGWSNYQISRLVIPKEKILLLAKEYEADEAC